jgi:hypothetical protein
MPDTATVFSDKAASLSRNAYNVRIPDFRNGSKVRLPDASSARQKYLK